MKKLNGKHVFQMAKIIKAANLKDELGDIICKHQNNQSTWLSLAAPLSYNNQLTNDSHSE